MNSTTFIIAFIIFILLCILYFAYRRNFKKIVIGAIVLITGGVKTGKSLLSVELAIREYRKRHRKWWILTHIFKKDKEEPLFYTNVVISFRNWRNYEVSKQFTKKPHRLDCNIMQITKKILLRQNRIRYGSVVYIQESSLTADSQEFTEKTRNATLSLFNKLFGHSTKGGVLFYDTQSIADNHYSMKRVISSYFFIQKSKSLFFFRVLYIREMVNNEMLTSTVNAVTDDIDFSTRKYIVWRWMYKKYDRYYFSFLTDNLPVSAEKFVYQAPTVSFSDIYNDFFKGKTYAQVCNAENKRRIKESVMAYQEKQKFKKKMLEKEASEL